MQPTEKQFKALENQLCRLFVRLKKYIGDDYRATDDCDDDKPGMSVTVGATFKDGELSWHYQTGDNSYSGGAYLHANWGVIYLYRNSNSRELAVDCVSQIADAICQH